MVTRQRFIRGLALSGGLAAMLALSACSGLPGTASGLSSGAPAAEASSSGASADTRVASVAQPQTQAPVYAASGITVVGEGLVKAAPDMAMVTVGVQTRGQTAQEAQAENTRLMTQVIDAVKAEGIAEKDIVTTGLSLYPAYGSDSQINGYDASNIVTVTVQDVDLAGQILDTAITAGANSAGNISFGLKDDKAQRQQALDAALKEARTKADAIATSLGLRVTSVQAISESVGGVIPYQMAYGGREADMANAAPVPVQPGELTVTAHVQVTFGFSQ